MSDQTLGSPIRLGDDGPFEQSLRPATLREFIGQPQKTDNLKTYIQGALGRGEPLDHVLLSGPPGLGKTTLAGVIAAELGKPLRATSGPALDKKGDITAVLTDLAAGEVLFIDEIHRLRKPLEEILYKAMEDCAVDIVIGQGPGARSITLALQPFTLIGATTRSGLLSAPLRDRFGISLHFDFYPLDDLTTIVRRSAEILRVAIAPEAAVAIAARSRGTPRIANRLLRRLRDFAEVKGSGRIDTAIAASSFSALAVDDRGFDEMDRRILRTILDKFGGGPVGLSTIATALQEERETIEDVYEPYLIQEGYMHITPRGRVVTQKTLDCFGRPPSPGSGRLF